MSCMKGIERNGTEGSRVTYRPETRFVGVYLIYIGRVIDPPLYLVFILPPSTILEKPITARERLAFGIPKTIDEGESPCGRGQPDEKRFSR